MAAMDEHLSVAQLQQRWERALDTTAKAVSDRPAVYAEVKSLVRAVIDQPLDIKHYFPTVEKLVRLLNTMDPGGNGSIFHLFSRQIEPGSIWQVRLLRMACKDLLVHLNAFEEWRRNRHRLKVMK